MSQWTNHLLIHESCGGKVRWVQDIERPGTLWTGQCLKCHTEGIPVEGIIPLEKYDPETRLKQDDVSQKELGQLEWDRDQDFEENQGRLEKKVEKYVA